MSFQQGLVVIVTSIKCLYIYFLRNSTNFPHPDLFDKFKTYWQQNYCKSSERVTGPIKKDFCLIQIIYFAKKKKEETFFQPQTMASTPPQLRWGHWRGCPEIWQNRTKLAPKMNSKPPAQHNTLGCFATTTYILLCPSKKIKETIIYWVQFAKSLPSFSAFIKSNCVIYILSALWPRLRWLYDILLWPGSIPSSVYV